MKLENIIAKIAFFKDENGHGKANVDLPVIISEKEDGLFHIFIDVLGGIRTFTNDKNKIDIAINEMLQLYFDEATSKVDLNGLINELKILGWQNKPNNIRFKSKDERFKMGTPKSLKLEVA